MNSDLLEGEKAGVAGRLSIRSNLCAKDLHVIQKSGSNRNQIRSNVDSHSHTLNRQRSNSCYPKNSGPGGQKRWGDFFFY
jgi:hypothetical protein